MSCNPQLIRYVTSVDAEFQNQSLTLSENGPLQAVKSLMIWIEIKLRTRRGRQKLRRKGIKRLFVSSPSFKENYFESLLLFLFAIFG